MANYNIKDAANATIAIAADEVSAGVYSPRVTPLHAGSDVATGNPLPTVQTGALPAGTNNIGRVVPYVGSADVSDDNPLAVKGNLCFSCGTFTRPADTTAYAIGDVVANSTSAAGLVELANVTRTPGGTGYIVRASFATDQKQNPSSYLINVYNNRTATISNDNAPHRELFVDLSKRCCEFTLGPLSTPVDTTNSTISRASDNNLRVPFACEAGCTSIFYLPVILTANTPASAQNFTLRIATDVN